MISILWFPYAAYAMFPRVLIQNESGVGGPLFGWRKRDNLLLIEYWVVETWMEMQRGEDCMYYLLG
jgi:hypothetical protein